MGERRWCLGRKERTAARLYEGVEEGGESAQDRQREMRLRDVRGVNFIDGG